MSSFTFAYSAKSVFTFTTTFHLTLLFCAHPTLISFNILPFFTCSYTYNIITCHLFLPSRSKTFSIFLIHMFHIIFTIFITSHFTSHLSSPRSLHISHHLVHFIFITSRRHARSYGCVYAARRPRHTAVAIKELFPHHDLAEEVAEEVGRLMTLSHDGVCSW